MISLPQRRALWSGFSLVELLAATAVLLLILAVLFQVTQGTTELWTRSTSKTEGFRDIRAAFESITRELSQATLNTYLDYADAAGNFRDQNPGSFVPDHYGRRSDLHFINGKNLLSGTGIAHPISHSVFFQSPQGLVDQGDFQEMPGLVNACGFFVQYSPDPGMPSHLPSVSNTNRFRLMQFIQPSEKLTIYSPEVTNALPNWNNKKWFVDPLATAQSQRGVLTQLGRNVIALVVLPKLGRADETSASFHLSSDYEYDSRNPASSATLNQLPPIVRVAMVVIDEASAIKLGNSTTPPNLGVQALFQNAEDFLTDLSSLEDNLLAKPGNASGNRIKLTYEIFQTDVAIHGAKWSSN